MHPCIHANLQETLLHGRPSVSLLHIFRIPLPKTPLKGCFCLLIKILVNIWLLLGR